MESKILRKQVGVNIEKAVTMKETDRDDLKKQVNKFLEENSTICPDKDKVKDRKPTRYRHQYLKTLWIKFQAETLVSCDYSTFCRSAPNYIIKPKPSDWGTCLCVTCLNPEIKLERLAKLGHVHDIINEVHFEKCMESDEEYSKLLSRISEITCNMKKEKFPTSPTLNDVKSKIQQQVLF